MVGPETLFKIELPIWLDNAMLNMVFTNNRATLLLFQAEFTESMLDTLLYPQSIMGPPWLGLEKFFKI